MTQHQVLGAQTYLPQIYQCYSRGPQSPNIPSSNIPVLLKRTSRSKHTFLKYTSVTQEDLKVQTYLPQIYQCYSRGPQGPNIPSSNIPVLLKRTSRSKHTFLKYTSVTQEDLKVQTYLPQIYQCYSRGPQGSNIPSSNIPVLLKKTSRSKHTFLKYTSVTQEDLKVQTYLPQIYQCYSRGPQGPNIPSSNIPVFLKRTSRSKHTFLKYTSVTQEDLKVQTYLPQIYQCYSRGPQGPNIPSSNIPVLLKRTSRPKHTFLKYTSVIQEDLKIVLCHHVPALFQ